jgi:hypothetical protein
MNLPKIILHWDAAGKSLFGTQFLIIFIRETQISEVLRTEICKSNNFFTTKGSSPPETSGEGLIPRSPAYRTGRSAAEFVSPPRTRGTLGFHTRD